MQGSPASSFLGMFKAGARAISSAVERLPYTQDVGGSIPSSPTKPLSEMFQAGPTSFGDWLI